MKKISLKGISEILSEKELKNVLGGSGSGSGTCGYRGEYWVQVQPEPGFQYAFLQYELVPFSECNVPYSWVEYMQSWAIPGTFWWCCDTCSSSSYCG